VWRAKYPHYEISRKTIAIMHKRLSRVAAACTSSMTDRAQCVCTRSVRAITCRVDGHTVGMGLVRPQNPTFLYRGAIPTVWYAAAMYLSYMTHVHGLGVHVHRAGLVRRRNVHFLQDVCTWIRGCMYIEPVWYVPTMYISYRTFVHGLGGACTSSRFGTPSQCTFPT